MTVARRPHVSEPLPTRGRVRLVRSRSLALILGPERFVARFAPLVEPPQRPRRMAGQGVGGQERQGDRRVGVAGHRVGQRLGIDLAPGHRLAGRRAREAAGVGAGVGDLEEVVVTALGQAEDFLDLRLGLEDEVLGAAAAEDQDARLAAARAWRRRRSPRSR